MKHLAMISSDHDLVFLASSYCGHDLDGEKSNEKPRLSVDGNEKDGDA